MNSLAYYPQITALIEDADAQRRGYQFEHILREMLPWHNKPPISVSTRTEQLDAFFEWNSWHFLVEAKAKADAITAGSHDWEDFALKIRNRGGKCIGLFCSISEVRPEVINEAMLLNRQGMTTIVIHGDQWKQLTDGNIPFPEFLRYLVFIARAQHLPTPTSIDEARSWIFDRKIAAVRLGTKCQRYSAVFLRRHKLVRHESVYVSRVVDNSIFEFSRMLKPAQLANLRKQHSKDGSQFTIDRAAPRQIFMIRDVSGSGKTTLGVQIALQRDKFFGVASAALQSNIDCLSDEFQLLSDGSVLNDLISADRPLIYVVDSLDEAVGIPGKHKEVRSLIRELDTLNEFARNRGMMCFPIGVVFTVREDFWREWESLFEGRPISTFVKRFSQFLPDQMQIALQKYAEAYQFKVSGGIDAQSLRVLAQPFNLQIFAEANEYRGEVQAERVLDENVLALYFERKKEDVLKRPITGFTSDLLMPVLSRVSVRVADAGENAIHYDDFVADICDVSPVLKPTVNQVIKAIASEQILIRDSEDVRRFRFRHMRFVEYLVAYHIAGRLAECRDPAELDRMVSRFVRGDFLSLYYVHEFISFICRTDFPGIYESLTDYYSRSNVYVRQLVIMRRGDIASGLKTNSLDIEVIRKSAASATPEIIWDTFFVVAARSNARDMTEILEAFRLAWKANIERPDRWKLIAKVGQHGLALEELPLVSVLNSDQPKDWLVLAEAIVESGKVLDFPSVWREACGWEALERRSPGPDWYQVRVVFEGLAAGTAYERGMNAAQCQ